MLQGHYSALEETITEPFNRLGAKFKLKIAGAITVGRSDVPCVEHIGKVFEVTLDDLEYEKLSKDTKEVMLRYYYNNSPCLKPNGEKGICNNRTYHVIDNYQLAPQ